MSTTYPDLSNNFPDSLDVFTNFLNITSTDAPIVKQYFEAVQASNFTLAQQLFNQIPNGSQKILTAQKLNLFSDCLASLERFYADDIETYVATKQIEWEGIIEEFSYQGVYDPATQYQLNNYVTYTTAGITNLYIATVQPPIGTAPSNTSYWRVLTIRGIQGQSGDGMSFMGGWSSAQPYTAMDCVTYDSALWGCLIANTNQTPYEGSTYWKLIFNGRVAIYPVSATQPAVQEDGALWFQIV